MGWQVIGITHTRSTCAHMQAIHKVTNPEQRSADKISNYYRCGKVGHSAVEHRFKDVQCHYWDKTNSFSWWIPTRGKRLDLHIWPCATFIVQEINPFATSHVAMSLYSIKTKHVQAMWPNSWEEPSTAGCGTAGGGGRQSPPVSL